MLTLTIIYFYLLRFYWFIQKKIILLVHFVIIPNKNPFLHVTQSFYWSPTAGLTCFSFLSLHFYIFHGRVTSPLTHVSHFLQNSTKYMTLLEGLLRLKQLIDSFIYTVHLNLYSTYYYYTKCYFMCI